MDFANSEVVGLKGAFLSPLYIEQVEEVDQGLPGYNVGKAFRFFLAPSGRLKVVQTRQPRVEWFSNNAKLYKGKM